MKGTARSLLLGSILVSAIGFSACSDDGEETGPAGGSDSGGADNATGGKTAATGGKAAGGGTAVTTGGTTVTGGGQGNGGTTAPGAGAGGAATGGTSPVAAGAGGGSAGGGTGGAVVAGAGGAVTAGAGGAVVAGAGGVDAAGAGGDTAGAPGETAGAGGTAGAGPSGFAKLFVPLSSVNAAGAAGAAGAAPTSAEDKDTDFEVDFGDTAADLQDLTTGTITVVAKVITTGNAGGIQVYIKNGDPDYKSAYMKPGAATSAWINFSDLKDWTTLTFDLSGVTGDGTFDITKIRYIGINVSGGGDWDGAVWADTTVIVDSITFSGTLATLDRTFDSTLQDFGMSSYQPVAGSAIAWSASE